MDQQTELPDMALTDAVAPPVSLGKNRNRGTSASTFAFFNNRLNISADGFWITNSDLLYSHSLASSSGYIYTTENVGEMTNRGFELSIGATPIRTQDWTWNVNFNLGMDR